MQLYLQSRFTWSGSKLLRHLIQALAIYLAVWVSLSRVSDYKHHWSDVLAGSILGTLLACLTVCASGGNSSSSNSCCCGS